MSNLSLTLNGHRATLANEKDGRPVASLRGRVQSRTEHSRGQTIELLFEVPRLTHTFALSTASLVDNNITNAFHFPGAEVGLERASGTYRVRLHISNDRRVVNAFWTGEVDRWTPSFAVTGWRPETQTKALALFKREVRQSARPMKVRGSFSNRNLMTSIRLGGRTFHYGRGERGTIPRR